MLVMRQSHFDEITAHAERDYPRECCGILLGCRDQQTRMAINIVACRNIHPQSRSAYNIDPADLIRVQREAREHDQEIVGFYHSHPDHAAIASETDLQEANWPGCSYLIASVISGTCEAARSWLIESGAEQRELVEEPLIVLRSRPTLDLASRQAR